jgi:hypothetical protein
MLRGAASFEACETAYRFSTYINLDVGALSRQNYIYGNKRINAIE